MVTNSEGAAGGKKGIHGPCRVEGPPGDLVGYGCGILGDVVGDGERSDHWLFGLVVIRLGKACVSGAHVDERMRSLSLLGVFDVEERIHHCNGLIRSSHQVKSWNAMGEAEIPTSVILYICQAEGNSRLNAVVDPWRQRPCCRCIAV